MKVRFLTLLFFICLMALMFSCEQEEITAETPTKDSTVAVIDSSQLPHNLFWNGHYYLLEFDSAYAWYSSSFYKTTLGGGAPAPLVFQSDYTDVYSGEKFMFYMVYYNIISNVNTNHLFYDSNEAKQSLQTQGESLIDYLDWNYHGAGAVMRHENNYWSNVFPEYNDSHAYLDEIEVLSYQTNVGAEVTADFHIKVTRPQFYLDLVGMFRAQ